MSSLAKTIFKLGIGLVCAVPLLHAPEAHSQQLKEVSIGIPTPNLATALPRVAKEMGLFAKNGLEPKFTMLDNASVAAAALIAGSVQMTLGGPTELIAAQAKGQKVITLAASYAGQANTLVLSKAVADKLGVSPKAPINERLKALDGLLIAGTSPTSTGVIVFKGASAAAGANMRFTFMNQNAMQAALEAGAVQGFLASAPFWIQATQKGSVAWIISAQREIPEQFAPVNASVVQAMSAFAEANPDVIKAVQKTFADLGQAVDERPAEVKAATVKLFPEIDPQTIELFLTAEKAAWKGRPPTAKDMARELEFMKISGIALPDSDKLDPAGMVFDETRAAPAKK